MQGNRRCGRHRRGARGLGPQDGNAALSLYGDFRPGADVTQAHLHDVAQGIHLRLSLQGRSPARCGITCPYSHDVPLFAETKCADFKAFVHVHAVCGHHSQCVALFQAGCRQGNDGSTWPQHSRCTRGRLPNFISRQLQPGMMLALSGRLLRWCAHSFCLWRSSFRMSITLLRGPKGVLFGFVTPSTKVRSSEGWMGLSLCAVINHQRCDGAHVGK